MKKKLVLIAGIPGVGKSTVAHEVSAQIGGAVIDVDVFKRTMVDRTVITQTIDPPEVRWTYYSAALEEAFSVLDSGAASTVVIDEVFHLGGLRKRITETCAEKGVRVLWVEVLCSYGLVEERIRTQGRDGHILSAEKTLEMYLLFQQVFEGFADGERHVVFENDGRPIADLAALVRARLSPE